MIKGLPQYATISYATIRYDTIRYDTLRYGTLRYATTHYDALRYTTLRYDTLRHTALRYDTMPLGQSKYMTFTTMMHVRNELLRLRYYSICTMHYAIYQFGLITLTARSRGCDTLRIYSTLPLRILYVYALYGEPRKL